MAGRWRSAQEILDEYALYEEREWARLIAETWRPSWPPQMPRRSTTSTTSARPKRLSA